MLRYITIQVAWVAGVEWLPNFPELEKIKDSSWGSLSSKVLRKLGSGHAN